MLQNRFRLSKTVCVLFLFCGGIIFFSCHESKHPKKTNSAEEEESPGAGAFLHYPDGFDTIRFPSDNHLTFARIELGKKIFFDTQFSSDKKISCASCHKPGFAFADTVAIHKGAHDSTNFRNTPSLVNIGFHPYFDYDGGVPTLELQVLVPFDGEDEMHSNLLIAAQYMNNDPGYVKLAKKAYNRKPDPYVIVRALAAYQRSLVSAGSRYDLYKKTGKGFTDEEKSGMALFFSSKTNCSKCHSGALFTNFAFENIGIPNTTKDTGRTRLTLKPEDYGKFKTPSLRNVSLTAPYMHDGSLKTLEDVIDFYAMGGISQRNKSALIKKFNLSAAEKKSLVAFLKTLEDTLPRLAAIRGAHAAGNGK